jgi:glutathionyl-hydroquinone reductase
MNSQISPEEVNESEFARQEDAFRDQITADGSSGLPAVGGRYHLYISLACPWACRTLIVRNLKGLHDAVGVTVAAPIRDEKGWSFRDGPGHSQDPINAFRFLREAYVMTDPKFEGRVTVPVLWDKHSRRIVNNSEDDICRMFNDAFNSLGNGQVDLFPRKIESEHAALAAKIYDEVNNGVYKAGFAVKQSAYEKACRVLFAALDELETRLATRRFLFGPCFVEADWRLFCTLIRFDAVYHGHFKCNLRRIVDYKHLQGYLLDLYQQLGIAETVNFDHIKRHYYMTHPDINPNRIVPIGPALDLTQPHGRQPYSGSK